ncbi:hypothetical protein LSCM1_06753 [Leishmania martiniquensis]|uniref:Calpain catalytic domain-containing protein n=1 Tax=Leishmania martiniquensis TaxID=1580590 RepID=A0A836HQI4_9TRYP|nr:hypothetical protein LSCM1_06753 [Leishmania martiniquensis]
MTVTREQAYLSVCKELNEPPLQQLLEELGRSSASLDVSRIYVPRRHFRCLLQYVEERPDIEELILDGAKVTTEEANLLKESLLRSCVSKVSLQRIKLDSASAYIIRQLCIENSNLVSVVLNDTYIPSSLADEIMVIADLNRLNAESLRSMSTAGARQDVSNTVRWRLCKGGQNRILCTTLRPSPSVVRRVVDSFIASYETVFSDFDFQPDMFDHPLAEAEAVRWNTFHALHSSQNAELEKSKEPFLPSSHYNNQNLCAALNVLRLYDALSKFLLQKRCCQSGLYVFRFFVGGSPLEVCVDDLLPCIHVNERCIIVGLESCSSPFYAAALEKAVAKVIGGYRHIQELSLRDCIELLTGCTCFGANLLSRSFSYATFDALRALSEDGHRMFACATPDTLIEERSLEESGVYCRMPYAILKMDVCRKNGAHYAFLIQVGVPSTGKPLKYEFEYEMYKTEEVNGNRVLWLTFEDFGAIFERAFLLLWPFDDAVSDYKTTLELRVATDSSFSASRFAENPSFLIENEGNNSTPVMVSLFASSVSDAQIGTKCLFYKATGAKDEGSPRRYNICEENGAFESEMFEGGEGFIFFKLLPRERLQMTLSSRVSSSFRVRVSAVENVNVIQLPDTMTSLTFSAQWNTFFKGKRFSDDVFRLCKNGAGQAVTIVLALSQTSCSSPPFPLGVLGWKGTSFDVVDATNPHFSTLQERSLVCVHTLVLTLAVGESIFLLPYCCGARCHADYDFTVFSKERFTLIRAKTASVLRCT